MHVYCSTLGDFIFKLTLSLIQFAEQKFVQNSTVEQFISYILLPKGERISWRSLLLSENFHLSPKFLLSEMAQQKVKSKSMFS